LLPINKAITDFRKDNSLGLRKICARCAELILEDCGLAVERDRRRRTPAERRTIGELQ